MPPKGSGRKRAAARGPAPRKPAAAKQSADASPATPPPPATPTNTKTTASPEPPKSDANGASAVKSPETTPLASPATRPPSSRTRKPTVKAAASKSPAEVVAPVPAPDTPSEVITDAVSSGKISEANDEISERKDPISQEQTLVEKAPENAASETESPVTENVGESSQGIVAEAAQEGTTTKTGTRTVVRKTVRVVKKVVKKKVAKRVQKEQAVSAIEESGKTEVEGEDENPNPNVSETMEAEEPKTSGHNSMEVDDNEPAPNDPVPLAVENPNYEVGVSMEVENPNSDSGTISQIVENSSANGSGLVGDSKSLEPEAAEEKETDSLKESLSEEAPVLDSVEDKNNSQEEKHNVSGDPNVVSDEVQDDETDPKNVDSEGGQGVEESKKEVGDGVSQEEVGAGDAIAMSGEMEALERRRRRKTEIFIGGLDREAKEEDVRKVFQEAGEILDVRVVMNDKTGKNKGFAFVRYASADDAKMALTKFAKVEICGKQCGALPAEGNDTIFLGNIDKKWKTEDVLKLLQGIGIDKIDKVTVVADPIHKECNRGFAFLELETSRDAQTALRKLQKKDVFGTNHKIKVAWAEPLSEPDEEEMLKVKSVYAEYLPSSWDEDKVKDFFNRFGEVENVVLARNLLSSKRKDFAFVNYSTREAALACIEAFNRGTIDDETSKDVKVSLAKPVSKGRQGKHGATPISKEPFAKKPKPAQSILRPHQPVNKVRPASSNYDNFHHNRSLQPVNRSSTTSELVHLLREQASWRQPPTSLGSVDLEHPSSSGARKRSFSSVGDDTFYSDSRGYPRTRFESSFPAANPSYNALPRGLATPSLPYYHPQTSSYPSGSFNREAGYPNSFQARGGPPNGHSGLYRRY